MTGWAEWVIIGAVGLLVWHAKRLPELPGALRESMKAFKKGLKDEMRPTREVTEYRPRNEKQ